jgi:hypothetical protein
MQRDRRRVTKVVALFMVLAMVAVVGASLAVSGGTSKSASTSTTQSTTPTTAGTTTTTIDPALLSEPAKELLALAAKGRASKFHVAFTVTGDSFASDVSSAAVEVWRANGMLRQDTSQTAASGVDKSQTFAGPDGTTQCLQAGSEAPACTLVSTTPATDEDLVFGVEVLVRTGAAVVARDDVAAGHPVRCFDVDAGTAPNRGSVCFSGGGAPVSLLTPHFTLTLSSLDDVVDDSTFVLPSPVTVTTVPAN